jgi:hypothetical protein
MKMTKDAGYGVRVRAGEVELEQHDELECFFLKSDASGTSVTV